MSKHQEKAMIILPHLCDQDWISIIVKSSVMKLLLIVQQEEESQYWWVVWL